MSIKHSFINGFLYKLLVIISLFTSVSDLHAQKSFLEPSRTDDFVNTIYPIASNTETLFETYGDNYRLDIKDIGENRAVYYFYDSVGEFIFFSRTSDEKEWIIYWELEAPFLQEKYGFYTLQDVWAVFGPPKYQSESTIRYTATLYYLDFYLEGNQVLKAVWNGYFD